MSEKKRIFYGWWIVLASASLHFFSNGTFYYGFTSFFNPIRQTFGWTAAVTSVAFALRTLESGVLGPIVGILFDKLGPRKLMLFGWGVAGLGFMLMSRINSLVAFYATFAVIAMGVSFGIGVVTNSTVANWFVKKRSRALTFVFLGNGASGSLVPIIVWLISQFGWRTSLTVLGAASWLFGLPLSLVMRHKPRQYGYLPDGETETAISASSKAPADPTAGGLITKEALRTRAFWLLAFVLFFQQTGMSALLVHIMPYLESLKIPTSTSGMVVMGVTISSLIGRLGFGLIGDFVDKRYLMAIAIFMQVVGILIFSFLGADKHWLTIIFLLTYGPGLGGQMPLRPALQADYFGIRNLGSIMGLMSSIAILGGLASPVFAGWVFDVTKSYRLAWQLFALATLPAVPLMLMAKSPRAKPGLQKSA